MEERKRLRNETEKEQEGKKKEFGISPEIVWDQSIREREREEERSNWIKKKAVIESVEFHIEPILELRIEAIWMSLLSIENWNRGGRENQIEMKN